jgi:hypothetical protein
MKSAQLHSSLHAFAVEAAYMLGVATSRGDEVGFEVVQERSRSARPALYCYRPLTAEFIARHWEELRGRPSALTAMEALLEVPGLPAYVESHAIAAAEDLDLQAADNEFALVETALRCFTVRVFDGSDTTFELHPERFEPAYRELHDNALQERRTEVALLGLLRGVSTRAKEIPIGEGILLAPLARLGRVPPDADWTRADRPALVVAIDPGEEPDGLERALTRMRDLQTALRLYAGGISLAPLAWIHSPGKQWRALSLGNGGRSDGKVALVADQAEELEAFATLVTQSRPTEGEAAWAFARFELGCEREDPFAGLTDQLLALRALLEPEGPRSGKLAARVAALCAEPAERAAMTERMMHAIALEQELIAGVAGPADARKLLAEVEDRVRQLLRDIISGELHGDLAALADTMIYRPDADVHSEAAPEFRVSRRPDSARFAADLFATPHPPVHAGAATDSVFDRPTTDLRLSGAPRVHREAPFQRSGG